MRIICRRNPERAFSRYVRVCKSDVYRIILDLRTWILVNIYKIRVICHTNLLLSTFIYIDCVRSFLTCIPSLTENVLQLPAVLSI